MQTSYEILIDVNPSTKKVWSKPLFEIISHDNIKTGHHPTNPEHYTYTS
jgi:hypothetical protein